MSTDDGELEYPGRSRAEVAVGIAKAGIASVPLVGGGAAELFALVLAPSLDKRRDEWARKMAEVVDELRQRLEGFDPADLEGNEPFVSAVLAASVVAVKSHQQEKLDMLRNAMVNAAMGSAPEQHEQMSFLRFVDELTPMHVRMLAFLDDPGRWFDDRGIRRPELMMGGVSTILEAGMPEFAGRRELQDEVAAELEQRRLAQVALHTTMTGAGVWAPRTTPRGRGFLAFISLDGAIPGSR